MITAKTIITAVAERMEVLAPQITSRTRTRQLLRPRYMAVAIIREAFRYWTLSQIAEAMNYKDHTSVIKALKSHSLLMATCKHYLRDYTMLAHQLLAATPAHQS